MLCVSEPLSVLMLAAGAVAVLLPVKQSADFMQRWLGDATLQKSVQAVLVDDTGRHNIDGQIDSAGEGCLGHSIHSPNHWASHDVC